MGNRTRQNDKESRYNYKYGINDSPEIPDRGETSEEPGLPLGQKNGGESLFPHFLNKQTSLLQTQFVIWVRKTMFLKIQIFVINSEFKTSSLLQQTSDLHIVKKNGYSVSVRLLKNTFVCLCTGSNDSRLRTPDAHGFASLERSEVLGKMYKLLRQNRFLFISITSISITITISLIISSEPFILAATGQLNLTFYTSI